MPKRTDIQKIMIIGGGPVIIGQAGQSDCAATIASKTLMDIGYEVVAVDSNPDAHLTDIKAANRTYIEPLTSASIVQIIEKEAPCALFASASGTVAMHLSMQLQRNGALSRFGVEMIGSDDKTIAKCEDRRLFKETMAQSGLPVPQSGVAGSIDEGMKIIDDLGFPAILRPSYSLAGAGSAIAYNREEYMRMLSVALETSPIHQALIEKPMLHCKGIEYVVIRDCSGSVLSIASMERLDPLGIHGGDSITISPVQTLSEPQMANLDKLAREVADAVGVIGELSIMFAVDSAQGDAVILGAHPGASRCSALAEKITGLPISKIASLLAAGLNIDEISEAKNFAPSNNYFCIRLPRFDFEKFADADDTLDTSMKSIGEVIAFGSSFKEALQKGIRSLGNGRWGLGSDGMETANDVADTGAIRSKLAQPNPARLFHLRRALEYGMADADINACSGIDRWIIGNIRELIEFETKLSGQSLVSISAATLNEAKTHGYSDVQLAYLLETTEDQVRQRRNVLGIKPRFGAVNSGRAFFSTYSNIQSSDSQSASNKILILTGGPNRVGQGMGFDYCCAHSIAALNDAGCSSIVINCNPQAFSTDLGLCDSLYIEPLTAEDVLEVIGYENPMGVIVQMGGQSALDLSKTLDAAGVRVLGTSVEDLSDAVSPEILSDIMKELGLTQTARAVVTSIDDALSFAASIGYPVLAQPAESSCRRAIEIIYDDADLNEYYQADPRSASDYPVIIEKFLEDAVGVDADVICDGKQAVICGLMERIEQAGVHSGDSAASLPHFSLTEEVIDDIRRQSRSLATRLNIRGFINIHFAVKQDRIYVLQAYPAASLTIPFVSKAVGVDWSMVATRVMLGRSLEEQGITQDIAPRQVSVREAVFPFARFAGVDVVLGPEMKSTGAVMGANADFGNAYMKAEIAAGQNLTHSGTVFVSVANPDKTDIGEVAASLNALGFEIAATRGTAELIRKKGVKTRTISKIGEGRPDATDLVKNNELALIINTPSGKRPRKHEVAIRSAVVAGGIPIITTIAGAKATINGLRVAADHETEVYSIQELEQTH